MCKGPYYVIQSQGFEIRFKTLWQFLENAWTLAEGMQSITW